MLQAVHHIFTNAIMEFYEEALSLTCDLTTTKISNNMWEMLRLIYTVCFHELTGVSIFSYAVLLLVILFRRCFNVKHLTIP